MATQSWIIDSSNSEVRFQVKKLGIYTVRGIITGFTGEISFSEKSLPDTNFHVCISPSSIKKGHAKRDEHLQSKDFFFVDAHPKICFQSKAIPSIGSAYEAFGNLSILGITKKVSIPFSFSDGAFVGQFTINRSDFKLGAKYPAFFVGNPIQITINCKIRQA